MGASWEPGKHLSPATPLNTQGTCFRCDRSDPENDLATFGQKLGQYAGSCPIVEWHKFGASPCADAGPTDAARVTRLHPAGVGPVPRPVRPREEVTSMTAFHVGSQTLNSALQGRPGQTPALVVPSRQPDHELDSTVTPQLDIECRRVAHRGSTFDSKPRCPSFRRDGPLRTTATAAPARWVTGARRSAPTQHPLTPNRRPRSGGGRTPATQGVTL
jgi:hypothetical protein